MTPEPVLTPSQVKRLTFWSKARQKAILSAWCRRSSPRMCIRLMCLECVGEDIEAIKGCVANTCPLWWHRPFVDRPKMRKGNPGAFKAK